MPRTLGRTFSSLKHEDYRRWWMGQCISLVGSAMQSAALGWLVYSTTGSAAALGTLAVFRLGPLLLLALPAGVLIDRWPKRRVLIATQTSFMLQATVLSCLAFGGRALYQAILLVSLLSGVTQAFDAPCRRSFLVDLVGREDLLNAVSLNSALSSMAAIAGPALAGVAMAKLGGGWCFLISALSRAVVVFALLAVSTEGKPSAVRVARGHFLEEAREGLRHIMDTGLLRTVMGMALVIFIFGLNDNVIVPVFADRVLDVGVRGYGNLLSSVGIGGLLGAIFGAAASHRKVTGRTIALKGLGIGATLTLLSTARTYAMTTVLLAVLGFLGMVFANTTSSATQSSAEPALRGRVMSVYAIVEMGTMPIGNALTGLVVDTAGARAGFLIGGAVSVALLAWIAITQWSVMRQEILGSRSTAPS